MSNNDKKNQAVEKQKKTTSAKCSGIYDTFRSIKTKCINCCIIRLCQKLGICFHSWIKTTCINCCINRYMPSFVCIIIFFIPFCYIISGYNGALDLELSILFSISLELIVLVVSYMLFPRIVIIIDKNDEHLEFILWADGKQLYKKIKKNTLKRQFTFQVWRKGEYDLYLEFNDPTKPEIATANTYDHHVCHVTFDSKEKKDNVQN